ncbi:dihydrolipoamide acetyltransferase family protein [Oligosphaera ethanolica]|uniref:Dihydrolipoamide acetyltransferase component of pyruvate dehydrogenase complex n=1 Tax=Oligosphaera ethanolica TaxID=760260 RepID=A0AAE3VGK6_9BACT|nr:dihydrolipoamide acetyltransferase family protein [Oligosphaera ethanolica]MDQ0290212.1 pyruvate dehydrogenase E2 component (dihydrolipoamide acetyltransferase) [Oligosphaera ethanolica]
MANAIVMPKAGNSVEECLLSKWRVKVGDAIKTGDIICDVETDKSAIEIEATAEGTVLALFWQEGDLVPVLQNILAVGNPGEDASTLAPAGGKAPAAAEPAPAPATAAPAPAEAATAAAAPATPVANAPLSPRAKKYVAEHPFVLPEIAGSGANGRIMEKDVADAFRSAPHLSPAAAALRADGVAAPTAGTGVSGMIRAEDMGKATPAAQTPAAPAAPAASSAPTAKADVITEKPFPQIRKIIAKRLHESLSSMAQYTLNAEADVTGLLALRQRIKDQGEALKLANINIGDMVMFAVIKTLQKHPEFNAEFADNVLRMHSAINVGFACDTPRGLMVPVLHNAQAMSLGEMAKTVKGLAKQANDGNLNPDLMAGGTFTVSNLGAFGITTFTPVISAPQVAILGVCKTILRPVRDNNGDISYRDFMQFSLTMNHMVIDGAPGARFLQTLKGIIENFELVCIAG